MPGALSPLDVFMPRHDGLRAYRAEACAMSMRRRVVYCFRAAMAMPRVLPREALDDARCQYRYDHGVAIARATPRVDTLMFAARRVIMRAAHHARLSLTLLMLMQASAIERDTADELPQQMAFTVTCFSIPAPFARVAARDVCRHQ